MIQKLSFFRYLKTRETSKDFATVFKKCNTNKYDSKVHKTTTYLTEGGKQNHMTFN